MSCKGIMIQSTNSDERDEFTFYNKHLPIAYTYE